MDTPLSEPTPRRMPQPRTLPASAIQLRTVVLLWLAPVALTLVGAPTPAILAATSIAAVTCALAHLAQPASIVITLPFFALLSPMTGLLEVGVARLVFSDLLFVLLAVQASWAAIVQPRHERAPQPLALLTLALLFALGIVAGSVAGHLVSAKPWLYLAQLAIVAFYAGSYATRAEDWLAVQRAWVVATVLGAAILLQAYGEGRNLDTLKDPDGASAVSPEDLLSLFRATYYYTGFHYILGLCTVWVATRLFFPAGRMRQLALLGALALLVLALAATVNKTAMAAAAAAIVLTAITLFARFRREMIGVMTRLAVLCVIGVVALGRQYLELAEQTQIDLIVERLFSASSLLIRLEVYLQALSVWSSSAWTVLLGFGPDFLDNSGNPTIAEVLKTSAATGYVEGTVDSAWLSYLIELGLPGALLLVTLFVTGSARALRGLRHCARFDASAFAQASLVAGLIFLAIAMTTQMLGYSKTSWLPLQLLVVAAIGLRARREG